jgi:hypothetical protein
VRPSDRSGESAETDTCMQNESWYRSKEAANDGPEQELE